MCSVLLSVAQLVSGDYSLSACAWHTHVKVLWKWTHNLLCVCVFCVCGYISWLWRSQYSMAPSLWQVNMTFGATMKTAILYDLVVCYCVCVMLLPYYLRFKVRLKCVKVWIFCLWLCAFKNVRSSVFAAFCLQNVHIPASTLLGSPALHHLMLLKQSRRATSQKAPSSATGEEPSPSAPGYLQLKWSCVGHF